MDYNSSRSNLAMPEYGRIVQKMIERLKEVTDKNLLRDYALQIVNLMASISNQPKDSDESMRVVWDNFSELTEGVLELEEPYTKGKSILLKDKPTVCKYPSNQIAYKYYGAYIERLICTISEFDEASKKEIYLKNTANFMKMQYLLWNKESVSNELILKHVKDFGCSDVSILENLKLNDSFEMRSKDEFARKKNKKSAKKQYHSNQANAKMNQKVRHKK
jgi:Uri superfamily endonuclease